MGAETVGQKVFDACVLAKARAAVVSQGKRTSQKAAIDASRIAKPGSRG
jgi:hypothetical protein